MKKMNSKGFTLIELLAVITIMGILMMVAIPAVSRTIENSRRDTFGDVAQSYLNAVRNAVLADELMCQSSTEDTTYGTNVAATPEGTYYFKISTDSSDAANQQTTDLMESGGKSSWGNSNVKGYVKWTRKTEANASGSNNTNTKTEYFVSLADTAGHGTKKIGGTETNKDNAGELKDQNIRRQSIDVSGVKVSTAPADALECQLR